jgi:hypothetical protein
MKCKDCPFYLNALKCPKVMYNNAVTMSNPDGTIFEVSPACALFPPGNTDACGPMESFLEAREEVEELKKALNTIKNYCCISNDEGTGCVGDTCPGWLASKALEE